MLLANVSVARKIYKHYPSCACLRFAFLCCQSREVESLGQPLPFTGIDSATFYYYVCGRRTEPQLNLTSIIFNYNQISSTSHLENQFPFICLVSKKKISYSNCIIVLTHSILQTPSRPSSLVLLLSCGSRCSRWCYHRSFIYIYLLPGERMFQIDPYCNCLFCLGRHIFVHSFILLMYIACHLSVHLPSSFSCVHHADPTSSKTLADSLDHAYLPKEDPRYSIAPF